MAVTATIPRQRTELLTSWVGALIAFLSNRFPRLSATGCALYGASLFFVCAKKSKQKKAPPGIRVSLRSTPLPPVPLRGPAYKGRPCPFTPLAASMRLVPLRNTSTRPADGEFARMKVSSFRQPGVVGLPTATEQPRRRVDNAACGLSTSSTHGGQRCAVAHPTAHSVIVPTQSVRTIDAHTTNSNARATTSPAHQKLGPGSGPVRRLSGVVEPGVERHGCRESADGPGTALRRGPPRSGSWSNDGTGVSRNGTRMSGVLSLWLLSLCTGRRSARKEKVTRRKGEKSNFRVNRNFG